MQAGLLIEATNLGKSFGQVKLFSGISYRFQQPGSYALLGSNGSGKSTLLQLLYGYMMAGSGSIRWELNGQTLHPDAVHAQIALAAPYLELVEELTASEMMDYHFRFLSPRATVAQMLEKLNLSAAGGKPIRYFSSGMKQRLKLGLAFFADTPALFLDEPCTNLDAEGCVMYDNLVKLHTHHRLVVVASNLPHEYTFCTHRFQLTP